MGEPSQSRGGFKIKGQYWSWHDCSSRETMFAYTVRTAAQRDTIKGYYTSLPPSPPPPSLSLLTLAPLPTVITYCHCFIYQRLPVNRAMEEEKQPKCSDNPNPGKLVQHSVIDQVQKFKKIFFLPNQQVGHLLTLDSKSNILFLTNVCWFNRKYIPL